MHSLMLCRYIASWEIYVVQLIAMLAAWLISLSDHHLLYVWLINFLILQPIITLQLG